MTTMIADPADPGRAVPAPDRAAAGGEAARGGVRVDALEVSAYTVPTEVPEADGTAAWNSTTAVVVQIRSGDVVGTGWTYGPASVVEVVRELLEPVVVGADPTAVPAVWSAMVATVRNDTRAGLCGYAISAIDTALWDLKARLFGCSLAELFGRVRPAAPVYGSGGFTTFDNERLAAQLRGWVEDQLIPRVKIKIGESWGNREDRDLARIRFTREVIGPGVELFVDANGAYTPKQAVRLLREAADAQVSWFEEPVSSDDLAGLRLVREQLPVDVTAGEYGTGLDYFARMCAAGAVDCLQIDATRCGGYTEWFRCAAVAAAHQLQVSAHCGPNLHAHIAVATPNLRHVEYFADHARIEQILFDGTLDPTNGGLEPRRNDPGNGLRLNEERAQTYRSR